MYNHSPKLQLVNMHGIHDIYIYIELMLKVEGKDSFGTEQSIIIFKHIYFYEGV